MTTKNKKILYFISALLLVGILVYLYVRYKSSVSVATVLSDTNTTNQNTTTVVASGFPLKYGSKGTRVKQVQVWINKQAEAMSIFTKVPNAPLSIDGVWGSKTEAAIKFINAYGWKGLTSSYSMYPVNESFYYAYCVPVVTLKTVMNFEAAAATEKVNNYLDSLTLKLN